MNIFIIKNAAEIRRAADIAASAHRSLVASLPWLPARAVEDFVPRIEWMANEGAVYGLEEDGELKSFLGWFRLDDFRNLGPGALTPDWCWGVRDETPEAIETTEEAESGESRARHMSRLVSPLVRRMLSDLGRARLGVHAVGVPASSRAGLREFSLLGWGGIVLDAARPASDLREALASRATGARGGKGATVVVRPAEARDARDLSLLDARLAVHIAEPPVLMPDARGSSAEDWAEWISRTDARTVVAERSGGGLVGFIKAAPPGFDVSWFVHDPGTLAICGLWVDPSARGLGVGERLLASLVDEGIARDKTLVSVDCETHNPEARAFWLRYFEPVAWSFERRF